jgi:peptidoglycan hydrolase-like amidase
MGQWGALGYALTGVTYQSILAHFYPGTTLVTQPADSPVKVQLTGLAGEPLEVTSTGALSVGSVSVSAGQAARITYDATSGQFDVALAPTCQSSSWTAAGTLPVGGATVAAVGSGALVTICGGSQPESVRGTIQAVVSDGTQQAVNVLSRSQYLDSVVPSEMPAYWGSLGSPISASTSSGTALGSGFAALMAQAVAARSYLMAQEGQLSFADICDSTACQAYTGVGAESPITDLAVADTAGQVLELGTGQVALTQYSASDGGYTSPTAEFPAVADAGDSVCVPNACNQNHDWTVSISAATAGHDLGLSGPLTSLTVTQASGLGGLGGRVEQVTVGSGSDSVSLSGAKVASALDLPSDWFAAGYPVVRLAGLTRDGTAEAVSQTEFPNSGGAAAVVLVADDDYPDALAGGPLAARLKAPMLLTPPTELSSSVAQEIERVLMPSGTVYVLGGTAAISDAVTQAVSNLGYKVTRVAGDDRYATAVAIASLMGDPNRIFLATGLDFADALSAGPAAMVEGGAILLSAGSTQAPETSAYLAAHPSDSVVAVGGPAAAADPSAKAIFGSDRYQTSVDVAKAYFPDPAAVVTASGVNYPDALTGGPLAALLGGPTVLVPAAGPIESATDSYLQSVSSGLSQAYLLGGPAAVSDTTQASVMSALGLTGPAPQSTSGPAS